jgi:hypothetical protein
MTTFEKREEGFEKRFAVDEELAFKALSRRNKLLGLWLAQLLGRSGVEAEAYASALVASNVGIADEALFGNLQTALAQGGVEMSDNRIRRKMDETLAEARAAIAAGR